MTATPLVLPCLLLAALLSGCSGDDEPTAAPSSTPTPTAALPSSAAPSPTASPTPSATPTVSAAPAPAPVPAPSAERVVLTGDGVEVDGVPLVFGTPYGQAVGPLVTALGEPTTDTGPTDPFSVYGTCPGTSLRALEFAGGALVLRFGDVGGPGELLYGWDLTGQGDPASAPGARALVGDQATLDLEVGTTLSELQAGAADGTLTVFPADEPFAAGFDLADQSGGISGQLTGTSDADTVTFVGAGTACGE